MEGDEITTAGTAVNYVTEDGKVILQHHPTSEETTSASGQAHIQASEGGHHQVCGQKVISNLMDFFTTKDHKGLQTPLRITKPGGGGPRIHGSRLFTFLKKTPCAEFHQKMKVYGPVFIIIVLSSPQMEANIW